MRSPNWLENQRRYRSKPSVRRKTRKYNRFYARKRYHSPKHHERLKAYQRERKRKYKHLQRPEWLRRKYGITVKDYDKMFAVQNGRCAICGKPVRHKRVRNLDVDHNHVTGKVRGLLCGNCNRGVGLLQESPEILESAAAYLRVYENG